MFRLIDDSVVTWTC